MSRRAILHAWPRLLGVGVLAGMLAGTLGCRSETYSCSSDEQCTNGATPGVCQLETGWCSFEDSQCPSMQRYGSLAAESLANTCVPLPEEQTSGPPSAPESPIPRTHEGTSGTSGNPFDDDESSSDGTTGDVDPPPPPTTGGSESTGFDEETTGEPVPACAPILFDDFDDGVVDPGWTTWSEPGVTLEEAQSVLRFSIASPVNGVVDAGIGSMDLFDFNEGQLRVEVTEFPSPASVMRLYVQLAASSCDATIIVEGDTIYALGGVGTIADDTAWLQVRTDGALAHAEQSADGTTWASIVPPQPIGCDMNQTRVYVFGGSGGASPAGPTVAVETLEACLGGP